MYFTTIEKLRASNALRQRVENVATSLHAINNFKDWDPQWLFPIAAIFVFNGATDMLWVVDTPSIHVATIVDEELTLRFKAQGLDTWKEPRTMLKVIDALLTENELNWRTKPSIVMGMGIVVPMCNKEDLEIEKSTSSHELLHAKIAPIAKTPEIQVVNSAASEYVERQEVAKQILSNLSIAKRLLSRLSSSELITLLKSLDKEGSVSVSQGYDWKEEGQPICLSITVFKSF